MDKMKAMFTEFGTELERLCAELEQEQPPREPCCHMTAYMEEVESQLMLMQMFRMAAIQELMSGLIPGTRARDMLDEFIADFNKLRTRFEAQWLRSTKHHGVPKICPHHAGPTTCPHNDNGC